MKILVKKGDGVKLKSTCLVVPAFTGALKGDAFSAIDKLTGGILTRALKAKEFSAEKGQMLLLHAVEKGLAERVLLVGLGKESAGSLTALRQVASDCGKYLADRKVTSFTLSLTGLTLKKTSLAERVQAVTEGLLLSDYRYDRYLPKKKVAEAVRLDKVTLLVDGEVDEAKEAAAAAEAISAGVCFARDLVNAPGNLKSPQYLAGQAVALAEDDNIKATLIDTDGLILLGCGALLGVAQGSDRPPYMVVLEYKGGSDGDKPVALVGKGVVFDTGGISLKPSAGMEEMKMDMGGAAAVLGAVKTIAALELPINVVAVVPAVENMPSGKAIRPGDILTSMSGKTIEVLNTDAEGRLILADALSYVERFNPCEVVDLATLTGACIIALGDQAAAVLGNDDRLINKLLKAGEQSGDRLWQLPLWEGYDEQIKGDFADIKNTGGRPAGTITAAAFLKAFAEKYNWAHLDIAGMAWAGSAKAGQPKGGTGFGVRVLVEYLRGECR